MTKLPHERTKTGRELLTLRRQIKRWIELNRGKVSEADLYAADYMAAQLLTAVYEGPRAVRADLQQAIRKTGGNPVTTGKRGCAPPGSPQVLPARHACGHS